VTPNSSEEWNLKPGDIVTFKHQGILAKSRKPKYPQLLHARSDMSWEDARNSWKQRGRNLLGIKGISVFIPFFCQRTYNMFSLSAKTKEKRREKKKSVLGCG